MKLKEIVELYVKYAYIAMSFEHVTTLKTGVLN